MKHKIYSILPNVLSHCHTKRRMGARGRANPSFGVTSIFFWEKSVSYQKKDGHAHPSFGVTTTQAIRDLFPYRSPNFDLVHFLFQFFFINMFLNFKKSVMK